MSADNWTKCPKCFAAATADKAKQIDAAEKSYGKIPASEFREMIAEAEKPLEFEDTLREDYGLGVHEDGLFYVSYNCSCRSCGFDFQFKHEIADVTKQEKKGKK